MNMPVNGRRLRRHINCIGLVFLVVTPVAGAGPPALATPAKEVVDEARQLVLAMKKSERGPYKQLRWFCNDGTVWPPQPYACAERGGGHQYAEYSDARQRLVSLGWSVGTIFQPLNWDELWDADRRHGRLRELPLERYLTDVDDSWVLRRARDYRGRVQIEDEEQAGKQLLLRLLTNNRWVAQNYLLTREVARVIPHVGGAGDRTRGIRRRAQELADQDPTFSRLRIKIHTAPDATDGQRVRAWIVEASRRAVSTELQTTAKLLAGEIDALYGAAGRAGRLELARTVLVKRRQSDLAALLAELPKQPPAVRLTRLAALLRGIRDRIASSTDSDLNLALMDLSLEAESDVIASANTVLEATTSSRRTLLGSALDLVHAGYGVGLFSAREHQAIAATLFELSRRRTSDPATYLDASRALERGGGWALGTVRHAFAEAMVRYSALEPKAVLFADDLLRGSPLLPLARVGGLLARDAELAAGITHLVFGKNVGGLAGLNPGAAIGRLKVVSDADLVAGIPLTDRDIVVLTQTVAELPPVGGIMSLAEGNILSHVQLLARNLGIPNAALTPSFAATLAEHAGRDVLFAVAGDGSLILSDLSEVPASVVQRVRPDTAKGATFTKVDAPIPDLCVTELIPLAELRGDMSGRIVGPKAANLGDLAANFPGRVEPAVALPFGLFALHVSGGDDSPRSQLERAFQDERDGRIDRETRDQQIDQVRQEINDLQLNVATRDAITIALTDLVGNPDTSGVFIRSDTNVEDLPEFTGAGLNETLANVIGTDAIMAGIARVWSSPFRRRAIAWRERALRRPEDVYPSVLLMKSVPVDKSGVMVTTDLATGGDGVTVAMAWGVGGAVDGDGAESLVLHVGGDVTLLHEAKAPYRRALKSTGGVEWLPAEAGQVLDASERAQVRELADELAVRFTQATSADGTPLPWDVELGFVNGRLTLFQLRPLVERGRSLANQVVRAINHTPAQPVTEVDLEGRLGVFADSPAAKDAAGR